MQNQRAVTIKPVRAVWRANSCSQLELLLAGVGRHQHVKLRGAARAAAGRDPVDHMQAPGTLSARTWTTKHIQVCKCCGDVGFFCQRRRTSTTRTVRASMSRGPRPGRHRRLGARLSFICTNKHIQTSSVLCSCCVARTTGLAPFVAGCALACKTRPVPHRFSVARHHGSVLFVCSARVGVHDREVRSTATCAVHVWSLGALLSARRAA